MVFIWSYIGYLAFQAALFVAGEMLKPDPEVEDAKPSSLGDFDFPTASADRPVPVVFGDVKIDAPNVVWYGDFDAEKVEETIETGLFSEETQTVGHKYYIGMHMILCQGQVDEISDMEYAGEKVFPSTFEITPGEESIEISEPQLLGGLKEGGGIEGVLHLQTGHPNQLPHPYLDDNLNPSQTGGDIPAFRGWTGVVWTGGEVEGSGTSDISNSTDNWTPGGPGYIGTSERVQRMAFYTKRYPDPLDVQKKIGKDANPAQIAYELLIDGRWGLGLTDDFIDKASFEAAGQQFVDEGLGLSFKWEKQQSIKDLLKNMLRHVDGNIFPDPRTGELRFNLVRNDYTEGDLPVLDEDAIEKLQNYSREAYDETSNEVKVKFEDRSRDFEGMTVSAQNLANFNIQGRPSSTTINYPMVKNKDVANKLAFRDIRALTTPLAKCSIEVNRLAYDLEPGDPFILKLDPIGIDNVIMRVQDYKEGSLSDGTIKIDAMQDAFSFTDSAFESPNQTEWENPVNEPQDLSDVNILELPYQPAVRKAQGDAEAPRPWVMVPDKVGALGYEIHYRLQGDDVWKQGSGELGWNAKGTLDQSYGVDQTNFNTDSSGFRVSNTIEFGQLSDVTSSQIHEDMANLVVVGDEIMAFQTIEHISGSTYELRDVWRGLVDTVPREHSSGEDVYILPTYSTTQKEFQSGDAIELKLIPRTPKGELDHSQATTHTITLDQRAFRPIRPGFFYFDTTVANDDPDSSIYFPEFHGGQIRIYWNHHNRKQNLDRVQRALVNDEDWEDNTSYKIEVLDPNGNRLSLFTDLTTDRYGTGDSFDNIKPTFLYNFNQEWNDLDTENRDVPYSELTFRLWAERDGVDSIQFHERTVKLTGYGMNYGDHYGGYSHHTEGTPS